MPESTADNPIQIAGALAETYAESLIDLAAEAGEQTVDDVADELNQLVALLREQPRLRAVLYSRSINVARRKASIEAIFQGRVSDLTYRFLQVLNDKGRLEQLPRIALAFGQLRKQRRGEVDVEVVTARDLDPAQLEKVRQSISQAIGKTAILSARTDPSMIGGLRVRIGDKLIDGSLATRLAHMKRQIIEQGRQTIRDSADRMLEAE